MTDFGSPEFADLVSNAIESAWLNMHVCLPGIVQSYDDSTKTVSVAPAIRRPVPVEDGTFVTEDLPVIQNVPVLVFGSPAVTIEVELTKGDTVLLMFLDLSPAAWRGTGAVADPPDLRKHGPGYPVAIPWMRPSGRASSDEKSTIGKSGGVRLHFKDATVEVGAGSDFVAMATKVDTFLSTLQAAIAGVVPAPPAPPDAGEPGLLALQAALASWPGGSVASSNLKAE